jgi:hypothetical protein
MRRASRGQLLPGVRRELDRFARSPFGANASRARNGADTWRSVSVARLPGVSNPPSKGEPSATREAQGSGARMVVAWSVGARRFGGRSRRNGPTTASPAFSRPTAPAGGLAYLNRARSTPYLTRHVLTPLLAPCDEHVFDADRDSHPNRTVRLLPSRHRRRHRRFGHPRRVGNPERRLATLPNSDASVSSVRPSAGCIAVSPTSAPRQSALIRGP